MGGAGLRHFASACRFAYVNRGDESVESAVVSCAEQCRRALGDDMRVDGMSVAPMPDQTVLVTVLASSGARPPDPPEE